MIPHSRPWISDADRTAVTRVLASEMIGQGDCTAQFERAIAAHADALGGVAVASGSAALVLAMAALGVNCDDEVILPTYVCTSVLEAVLTVRAKPILCDTGPDWLITADSVSAHLTARTRAIIVPHLYGFFADVSSFKRFGVAIIEDRAQAVGAPAESPPEADVVVYSFHPTKCLTCGEGGMCVVNDEALAERMREHRDGRPASPGARLFSPLGNLPAALGLAQLERYPMALARRRHIASAYDAALADIGSVIAFPGENIRTMHFRYPLLVDGGLERVQDAFAARGVAVRRGVDRLLHRALGHDDALYPNAVSQFKRTVSLPQYPALDDGDLATCTRAAGDIFRALG